VAFTRKVGRAAVGFQFADPVGTYLTPAHTPAAAASYVSLGGAGFCYPAGASVGLRYSEGDKVALALDWATNTLTFTVGARHATVPIPPQAAVAYPSLSVEDGEVVAEVAAEATPPAPPAALLPPLCLGGAVSLSAPPAFPATLTLLDAPALLREGGAAAWAARHRAALAALLTERGALLLRGFPLPTAQHFSALVDAFGWRDLPYEHSLSLAVRTPVCARVCTTNDGRSGGLVFHHEQAAAPLYPTRLFFYCEVPAPAGTGGATGLSPSWLLLERLEAAHPAFVADCARLGITYHLTLPPEQDASRGVGRSWRSFFAVATEAQAEARAAALGYAHSWGEGGVLRLASPVLPPVRAVAGPRGPATRVFFNQVIAQLIGNAREFASVAGALGGAAHPPCTFGDGSRLPVEPVEYGLKVCEELAVDVAWQQGDVALVDNMLVMHARRQWSGEGPRRVLASLVVDDDAPAA
jgi:alpha-ketoglutarate-dependent taurine dioxygenase